MVVSFHGGSPFQGFVTPILFRIRGNRRLNFQLLPGHRLEANGFSYGLSASSVTWYELSEAEFR
jgi:hypothetical protein